MPFKIENHSDYPLFFTLCRNKQYKDENWPMVRPRHVAEIIIGPFVDSDTGCCDVIIAGKSYYSTFITPDTTIEVDDYMIVHKKRQLSNGTCTVESRPLGDARSERAMVFLGADSDAVNRYICRSQFMNFFYKMSQGQEREDSDDSEW